MSTIDNLTYLGVGLYAFPEAARIIGVKPSTLRNWVSAYTNRVRGTEYTPTPVIARSLPPDEQLLTFTELVELLFVKQFRKAGLSMQTIRKAARAAQERFGTPYPFASRRFYTDGKHIFASLGETSDGEARLEDIIRNQLAFDELVGPFLRKLDYQDEQIARRFWPREHKGRVVLDPRRSFGTPIDAETGVPTATLYDAVIANPDQDHTTIAKWFGVPPEAVRAAVEYEESLLVA